MKPIGVAALLTLLALPACTDEAPLEGRHCPCATGWKCCANDLCVPSGESCGVARDENSRPHGVATGVRQPCGEDEDDHEDGTIDVRWSYFEDGWGNISEMRADRTPPAGPSDYQFVFDSHGNFLLEEDYSGPALSFRYSADYDAMGRTTSTEEDDDGDGNVDLRATWDYRSAQPIESFDFFYSDGTTQHGQCTYTLLADGRTDHRDCDWDLDGTIDAVSRYGYGTDGNGNSTKTIEHHRSSDDIVTWRMVVTYGSDGRFISLEQSSLHEGAQDLTLDWGLSYTYDDSGNPVSWENNQVSAGERDRSTFRYDCSQ